MPESPPLRDGQTHIIYGSRPYEVKNVGGVYSCSCPGWRNQHRDPKYRSCKHLVEYRGARDEAHRIFPGGRDGMPSTVSSSLLPHWPASGAGRAVDLATGRMAPEPSSVVERGERLAGGLSMRHPPAKRVTVPAKSAEPKPKPAPTNAWTKLLDDDHPLAEPIPVTPPANDASPPVPILAMASDEPDWSKDAGSSRPAAAPVIEPVALPLAPPPPFRGVLLAETWDGSQNIVGWHMSEKLDGVRAYWDGTRFLSRNGNVFSVPDWYAERIPKDVHLDGEFWMGRGRFQETSGYARRMDRGEHWREISYMIFDVPSIDAGFEDRMDAIGKRFILPAHCSRLPQAPCPDLETLNRFLATVEAQGGEGVMLRQPGSRYARVRSSTLLKVVSAFSTEVVVVGTMPGKGRHTGKVGALQVSVPRTVTLKAGKKVCTLKEGTRFEVGTGLVDAQREPGVIRIGAIVTVEFRELSKDGIPRFPAFKGVRDYE